MRNAPGLAVPPSPHDTTECAGDCEQETAGLDAPEAPCKAGDPARRRTGDGVANGDLSWLRRSLRLRAGDGDASVGADASRDEASGLAVLSTGVPLPV